MPSFISPFFELPIIQFSQVIKSILSVATGSYDFFFPKNPVTGERIPHYLPESAENFYGNISYPSTIVGQGGICSDNELREKVDAVFKRLLPHVHRKGFEYECTVIKSNTINAWALPGGKIAIYEGLAKGLQADSIIGFEDVTFEDKLAAVLSHEIAHTDIGHSRTSLERTLLFQLLNFACGSFTEMWCASKIYNAQLIINSDKSTDESKKKAKETKAFYTNVQAIVNVASSFFSRFGIALMDLARSRAHEFEADKYGISYMQKAGFNTRGALFLQKFFESKQPGAGWFSFLSTHPSSSARYKANEETIRTLPAK